MSQFLSWADFLSFFHPSRQLLLLFLPITSFILNYFFFYQNSIIFLKKKNIIIWIDPLTRKLTLQSTSRALDHLDLQIEFHNYDLKNIIVIVQSSPLFCDGKGTRVSAWDCSVILQVSVRKTKLFCSKDFSNFLANSISRISGFALTKDLGKFLGLNCSVPKTKLFCSKDVSNFLENTGSYYGEYAAKAVVPEDQLDMAVADMVENNQWNGNHLLTFFHW